MLLPRVKRTILDEICQNVKKTDVAREYKVARSTLSTIIKNESEIDAVLDNDVGSENRERIWKATTGNVEAALYTWFVDDHSRPKGLRTTCKSILGKVESVDTQALQRWMGKNLDHLWNVHGPEHLQC